MASPQKAYGLLPPQFAKSFGEDFRVRRQCHPPSRQEENSSSTFTDVSGHPGPSPTATWVCRAASPALQTQGRRWGHPVRPRQPLQMASRRGGSGPSRLGCSAVGDGKREDIMEQ